MVCNAKPIVRKFLIKCPTSYRTDLGLPTDNFETIDTQNFFRLWIKPEEYVPSIQGERSSYQRYYRGKQRQVRRVEYSVQINIRESSFKQYLLLKKIANASDSTSYTTHIPIEVWDYVSPELEDFESALLYTTTNNIVREPFTKRFGSILIDPNSGAVGRFEINTTGNNTDFYINNNLRFTFTEANRRLS